MHIELLSLEIAVQAGSKLGCLGLICCHKELLPAPSRGTRSHKDLV